MADIPLFPEFCRYRAPEKVCDSFGLQLTCVASFPEQGPFAETAAHGHMLTTILLAIIGFFNLSFVDRKNNPFENHYMTILTSFYALTTAFFAFSRLFWGVSELLLLGAAAHNLFEWFFFIQISDWVHSQPDFYRITYKAMFFIAAILVLVIVMPTLLLSVAVEQSFGIMLDFALVISYASGYVRNIRDASKDTIDTNNAGEKPKDVSYRQHQLGLANFYFTPLVAHCIHLAFTILPLVFANFHTQETTWFSSYFLEGAIYMSAPITHLLYLHWGLLFDRIRADPAYNKQTPEAKVLPASLRIKEPLRILIISFLLGQIPLNIIPNYVFDICHDVCPSTSVVVRTSLASVHLKFGAAWEDWIAENDLIATAHKQKGNLHYAMAVNRRNPDEYRIVERWDSAESLQAWTNGFASTLLENKMTQNLLKGGRLNNVQVYKPSTSAECVKTAKPQGAVNIEVEASCSTVWTTISDWSNCEWVAGCNSAIVSENDSAVRTLVHAGGKQTWVLRAAYSDSLQLHYEILDTLSKGFIGHIGLTQGKDTCRISYRFTPPPTLELKAIYDELMNEEAPNLKKLFAKPSKTCSK